LEREREGLGGLGVVAAGFMDMGSVGSVGSVGECGECGECGESLILSSPYHPISLSPHLLITCQRLF